MTVEGVARATCRPAVSRPRAGGKVSAAQSGSAAGRTMLEMLQQVLDAPVPAVPCFWQPLREERERRLHAGLVGPGERAERAGHARVPDRGEVRLEVRHVVRPEGGLGQPLDHDGAAHDHQFVRLVDTDGALTARVRDRPQPVQLEAVIERQPGRQRLHERHGCPVTRTGAPPGGPLPDQGREHQATGCVTCHDHPQAARPVRPEDGGGHRASPSRATVGRSRCRVGPPLAAMPRAAPQAVASGARRQPVEGTGDAVRQARACRPALILWRPTATLRRSGYACHPGRGSVMEEEPE